MNQPLPTDQHSSVQHDRPRTLKWTGDLHTVEMQCRLCLSTVLDTCWHGSLTEELLFLLLCCMSGIQHALRTWFRASLCDSSSAPSWQLSPGFLSSSVPLFLMSYTTVRHCVGYVTIFFALLHCFSAHISMIKSVINGQILSKSPLCEPSGRLCPSSCNVFLRCVKACSELNFLGDKLSIIALCFCNWVSNFICAF